MKNINGVVLLVSLLLGTGCNSNSSCNCPNIEQTKLNSAIENWEDKQIGNYTYVLHVSAPSLKQEKKKVTILDNEVSSFSFIPSNETLSGDNRTSDIKTVSEYFELIDEALFKKAYKINVSYDEFYSYPTSIFIDYKKDVPNDDINYTITHFVENDYDQIVCTEEDSPVCGKVEETKKTFLNNCYFTIDPNAIYLHDGACQ
jgi:hypothetical protein